MELIYGVSHFERERGAYPSLVLINLVAEPIETAAGVTLQSRPGLAYTGDTHGTGPIRALYKSDGAIDGDLFSVSGNEAFEDGALIGTIDGTGPARIDGFEEFVFFNAGETIFSYDGTDFDPVSFPDDKDVLSIAVGQSRLVAIEKDSGVFYWSNVLENVVDPLSFATAENAPDHLLDLLYLADRLILFGSETVETWQPTGDQDLPFSPVIGMTFQRGIKNTGACTRIKDTFAWVTEINQVCLGSPENVISNPDLSTRIAREENVLLWQFDFEGTEFLCVRLTNNTYVYNMTTGLWSEFTSYGESNWLPSCYEDGVFGTTKDGQLCEWTLNSYSDFDGELERRFRAWLPITEGTFSLKAIHLRTVPGQTPFITGPVANPTVELRTSKDGGFEWGSWLPRGTGLQGQYRQSVRWNGLGSFAFPGALIEFRMTDPAPFTVSGVYANQTVGSL
jgi:hypothetical protein